jgi:hypothetical protein
MKKKPTRTSDKANGRAGVIIAIMDQAGQNCDRIKTLGSLLGACGSANGGDFLPPEVVAHAGQMIADEAKALQNQLARLGEQMVR